MTSGDSDKHYRWQHQSENNQSTSKQNEEPANLEQMLDTLRDGVGDRETVSIKTLLDAAGSRSFAPALLVAGLIMFSPLSGIPGLPTTAAILVLLIASQMLLGRNHFWLPSAIERRSISRQKLETLLRWCYPVAGFIDRFLKPRLTLLTEGLGTVVIAVAGILVALSVPPMEILPFLATTAGAVLIVLALALIANDGVFALAAIGMIALLIGILVYNFL